MSDLAVHPNIERWDRRVVLAVATVYVLNTATYLLSGSGAVVLKEPARLAIFLGGTLLGYLLMVPAYLSLRWGFVLQLVLVVLGLMSLAMNIASPRAGATPPEGAYLITTILAKSFDILFACYLTWRLAKSSKPGPPVLS